MSATFTGHSGRTYTIERRLAKGAQGQTFLVRQNDGAMAVFKLFDRRFTNDANHRRTVKLVERRLFDTCPVLCAPVDIVGGSIGLGHIAPLAAGIKLDAYLEAPTGNYLDHLIAAAAIAGALAVLERCGVGHGDIQAENVMVEHRDGVLRARLIDFDNLIDPELGCPCAGHPRYFAPEVRAAVAQNRQASPDLHSDRYAIGVLMHELLLARHPAADLEDDPAGFDRMMRSGQWIDDPAGTKGEREAAFPAELLDPPLLNLLRRALTGPRTDRPAAIEWFTALRHACGNVYVCDHCRYPFIVDGGKFRCVQCHKPFPSYRLTANGRTIATLERSAVAIGASELGAAGGVIPRHALLRRSGPDALIEPRGPTYCVRPGGRTELTRNREHRLHPGERLILGSVEVKVELASAA